jgi:hypothetical protein
VPLREGIPVPVKHHRRLWEEELKRPRSWQLAGLAVVAAAIMMVGSSSLSGASATARPIPSGNAGPISVAPTSPWSIEALQAAPLAGVPYQEPGLDLPGSTYLGPADLTSPANPNGTVEVLVSFDFSNEEGLDSLLNELSDPASPLYHHYLTHAEFDEEYGGNTSVYEALVGYFQSFGVTQLTTHPDRMSLTFQATPTEIESIFHTGLGSFVSSFGQAYYAPLSEPELPEPVLPYLAEVQGLSNYSEYLIHTDSQMATQQVAAAVGAAVQRATSSAASSAASSASTSPGSSSNPFTSTKLGNRTYDEPVSFSSSSNCDTTTCGQVLEAPDLQVAYNETGLFAEYGYPVNATVVALLWTDQIHRGSSGDDGNSFCSAQTSGTYSWDFFMPDVTTFWNYSIPSGEPMPRAVSMPQTGSGTYDFPSSSPGDQGYSASCNVDGDEGENTLDVAMEGALAPGANVFQVFGQGSSGASIETGFSDILSPSTSEFSTTGGSDTTSNIKDLENASVIANSWTTGSAATLGTTWNDDLKEAQTLGITVLASSGDAGTGAAADIDPPAAESYDTYGDVAVGGTTLVINATTLLRTPDHLATMASPYHGVGGGEIVWYEPSGSVDGFSSTYGTVGGVATSSNNKAPVWQNDSSDPHGVITGISSSGYGRGEPDISAVANDTIIDLEEGVYSFNFTCWVSSSCGKVSSNSDATTVEGTYFVGTSISDQVAGGEIATIDHALGKVGQGRVGFLDPAAYSMGQLEYEGNLTLHSFYGIGLYHNAESQSTYGAFSSRGWDADDGWGTIDAGNYTQNTMNYSITFTESGLSSVSSWSVTLTPEVGDANCTIRASSCSNVVKKSSTTTTIAFQETYGSYGFSIGNQTGKGAVPATGVARVAGASDSQGISFLYAPPTGLKATAVGPANVDLSWTNPTSGTVVDNHVYLYNGNACATHLVFWYDAGSPITSYDWGGLSASTTYSWEVTASNATEEGAPSNCASATTESGPAAPTNLTAKAVGSSTVNLSWTNPSGSLTGNDVYLFDGGSCSGNTVYWYDSGSPIASYQWGGLSASVTYSWKVTSVSSAGEGTASNCANATTQSGPPAPTGLTATTAGSQVVDLSWTNPSGSLTGNHVYLFDGSSCSAPLVYWYFSATAITSYAWGGLSASTTYSWKVSAVSSVGEGAASSCAYATTSSGPSAPTGLKATAVGSGHVNLTWTNPSGTLTGNDVYLYGGGSCSGNLVYWYDAPSAITSYQWGGLSASTTYSWKVTAVSSAGEGAPSNCANATTQSGPSAPTSLTASAVSSSAADLSWTNPSGSLTGNNIYLYSGNSCSGRLIYWYDSNSAITSYQWGGLSASTTYSWDVTAVSSAGEGAPSNCATATTP